jgi:hypothetical protein
MSEPDGATGEPIVYNGRVAHHADEEPEYALEAEPEQASWFEPAAQPAGYEPGQVGNGGPPGFQADDGHGWDAAPDGHDPHQAEWFLPTGRAGLLPESMTESWDDTGHGRARPETAAKPPWAGEQQAAVRDTPPPWESGPWPGPGEARLQSSEEGGYARSARPAESERHRDQQLADPTNWPATAALATAILPIVIPGVALGILGLRRAAVTGTGRIWSWLGIGLSVVWAIILVALLASGGSSTQSCGGSQNDVSLPVDQVLRDLATNAPKTVLIQDLDRAVSAANKAAAASSDVTAGNALASLTAGLQQALAAVSARHPATSHVLLHSQIAADAQVVSRACTA